MAHCIMPQRNVVQLSARTPLKQAFAPLPVRRNAVVAKGWREEKPAGGDSRLKEDVKVEADIYRKEAAAESTNIVSNSNNWAAYDNDMLPEERARLAIQGLQERWSQQKDKRTTVVLITGTVLGGLIAGRILDSVNHVPVLPDLFTFIGLVVTSKLFWDYVLFKDGRDRLRSKLSDVYLTMRDAVEADGPIQPSVRTSMSGGESLTDRFSSSSTTTTTNNNTTTTNNNNQKKTAGSSSGAGSSASSGASSSGSGVQDYSAYSTGKAHNPLADRGSGPSVKRAIEDEHEEFKTERDEQHGAPGTPYLGVDDEDLEEKSKGSRASSSSSAKQGAKTAAKAGSAKSQAHTPTSKVVREEREEIKTERDDKHGAPKTPYMGQDDEDVEVAPASAKVEQSGGGWPWGFGGKNKQQQQQQQTTAQSSGKTEGAHGAKGFGHDAPHSSSNNKSHKGSSSKPDGYNSNPDTL